MWIKYCLGIALGLIAAFILPKGFVEFISELALRFGRYMVFPVLVFGASSAFFKLKTNGTILNTTKWTAITIAGSSLILTVLGLVSILIVFNITVPTTNNPNDLIPVSGSTLKDMVMSLLPFSTFENFNAVAAGSYLLPAFVFAAMAGLGCAIDTTTSKPVVSVIDSAASVCYSVLCWFIEWFAVAVIAISCMWMTETLNIENLSTFRPLIILLLVDFLLIAGLIYPLILRFLCHDHRPFHVLYASICPILTGFFSGDSNLTLLVTMRHGRDSLGIHQPVADSTFPLFSIFARGGSALVTAVSFVILIRSNIITGFSVSSVLIVFGFSFLISFILGALPSNGTVIALATLCAIYGQDASRYIPSITPVSLILCSFAAAIDAATAMFGTYIVAVKTRMIEHIEIKKYV